MRSTGSRNFHPHRHGRVLNHVAIYPASHYVTTKEKMDRALGQIREELEDQVKYFNDNEMLVEAQHPPAGRNMTWK